MARRKKPKLTVNPFSFITGLMSFVVLLCQFGREVPEAVKKIKKKRPAHVQVYPTRTYSSWLDWRKK